MSDQPHALPDLSSGLKLKASGLADWEGSKADVDVKYFVCVGNRNQFLLY